MVCPMWELLMEMVQQLVLAQQLELVQQLELMQ
jgi:hypothetical protein